MDSRVFGVTRPGDVQHTVKLPSRNACTTPDAFLPPFIVVENLSSEWPVFGASY